MTCKKCGHQFCWICMWRFPKHNLMIHLYHRHLSFFITALIILSLIIYAFYYFGMILILEFFMDNFFWIIFYLPWSFSLSILNFVISNGFVIVTLAMIFGERIPFLTRMKGIFGILAFVWISISTNYFSTILEILKVELFIILMACPCLCTVIGCTCFGLRRRLNARRRLA